MSRDEQIREAAEKRREAMQERSTKPELEKRSQRDNGQADDNRTVMDRYAAFPGELRSSLIERRGKQVQRVDGYATVFEKPYEMWDVFGPYEEVVSRGAADATVANKPDVVFLVNHRGLPLARTGGSWNDGNSTMELSIDEHGLRSVAYLNPKRDETRNLILAMDDGNVTEMSFGFMIDDGAWSEDFSEYRINQFDLTRGDVSAVTYGANPHTSIAARQQEILHDLREAGPAMARAAVFELLKRTDLDIDELAERFAGHKKELREETAVKGRSLAYFEALLAE